MLGTPLILPRKLQTKIKDNFTVRNIILKILFYGTAYRNTLKLYLLLILNIDRSRILVFTSIRLRQYSAKNMFGYNQISVHFPYKVLSNVIQQT